MGFGNFFSRNTLISFTLSNVLAKSGSRCFLRERESVCGGGADGGERTDQAKMGLDLRRG